ncbi:hypothetical protein SFRURICE_012989 [Spodoptera frugiperda]|uniref:SFRICE_001553 n=1 Tax=Spodoptera frugiperda TaxID=7108 RepID=A0A2H1W5P5_SPOFR|nr:hypothetical protein SFRURICE_012989 [Spodoptera frugiperda]
MVYAGKRADGSLNVYRTHAEVDPVPKKIDKKLESHPDILILSTTCWARVIRDLDVRIRK